MGYPFPFTYPNDPITDYDVESLPSGQALVEAFVAAWHVAKPGGSQVRDDPNDPATETFEESRQFLLETKTADVDAISAWIDRDDSMSILEKALPGCRIKYDGDLKSHFTELKPDESPNSMIFWVTVTRTV